MVAFHRHRLLSAANSWLGQLDLAMSEPNTSENWLLWLLKVVAEGG